MKRLIPQFGDACLQSRGDAFTTLARSIVGQQISVKAAQTVWDRFALALLPRRLTPASVLKLKVDDMRAAGLSARKVEYLVDLALHFTDSSAQVDGRPWHGRRGHHRRAGGIRGIGRWTAEMFLIFHLLRPNVLPLDDVGLINGISRNYFRATGQPQRRARGGRAWAPWCSVATWYIWRSLDPLPGLAGGSAAVSRHVEKSDWRKNVSWISSSRSPNSKPRSKNCATCRTESAVDISNEIDQLSKKSQQLTKDIYSDLSPLADHQDRAPRRASLHAGLRRRDLHRLHRDAR